MALSIATSPHSVPATVERLRAALDRRGIAVLGHVDHAAGARQVGQELPDEQVLIFGDPRVGTPLMQEDPRVGYELPLRVLVWDAGGETHVAYRPPTDLADEYRLSARTEVLSRMTSLLEQLVAESTEP